MMQVVLLVGGLGTRLGDLTKQMPKPMVPINGKPYLAYQIAFLKNQGFTEIILLTGYKGEVIKEYFGSGQKYGVHIKYGEEKEPLGTGGGLKNAAPLLADEFLLLNGDSFLPIQYEMVCDQLHALKTITVATAYADPRNATTVPGNLKLNAAKTMVVGYKKGSGEKEYAYIDAGVLACTKEILKYCPEKQKFSLEEEVFPRLIAEGQMGAAVTQTRFYDIGTPERLQTIAQYLQ